MKNNSKKEQGFTLMEMIVYIGLTTVILTTFTSFLTDVVKGAARAEHTRDLHQDNRVIISRIVQEIKTAKEITSVEPSRINYVDSAGNNTQIYLDEDRVYIDDGSGAVPLTDDKVKVTGMALSSFGDLIGIDLSLNLTDPNGEPSDRYKMEASAVAAPRSSMY